MDTGDPGPAARLDEAGGGAGVEGEVEAGLEAGLAGDVEAGLPGEVEAGVEDELEAGLEGGVVDEMKTGVTVTVTEFELSNGDALVCCASAAKVPLVAEGGTVAEYVTVTDVRSLALAAPGGASVRSVTVISPSLMVGVQVAQVVKPSLLAVCV